MSAITFKPIVDYQRGDGTYQVRIRVTYERKSRKLTTNLSVTQSQLTRGMKIKDVAVQRKLDDLLRELRDRVGQLNFFALEGMDVDDVVRFLKRSDDTFRLDFPTFAREQIARMGAGAKNYSSAVTSLSAFLGRDKYDISEITSSVLRRWENWLIDRHGKGARAVSLYTRSVAHLHGLARDAYNDEEEGRILIRNPFVKYKCPTQQPGKHRNISPAIIELMLYYRKNLTGRERLGVDVFLLSFALMGANVPDIFECTLNGGYVHYFRRKTRDRRADRAEMRVRIEPCVRWLVDEYCTDGKRFVFAKQYEKYQDLGRAVNIGLHEFERRLGLTTPLTLYVCRHTFATIARSSVCNIDKSTVNEMICHVDSGMRVTDIYVEKDWAVIWEANARIQSHFGWSYR